MNQCSLNIFFIDWERPRSKSGLTNRRTSVKMSDDTSVTAGAETSSNATAASLSGNLGRAISRNSLSERYHEISAASIWRVYFVASGWTELQTLRRVAPSIQLFCTLFFLNVSTSILAKPQLNVFIVSGLIVVEKRKRHCL